MTSKIKIAFFPTREKGWLIMKKFAIIVSVICAFLFTAMGIKSVSAAGVPSYCVLVATDYGMSDEISVLEKLNQKVPGDMISPETTMNAVANVVSGEKDIDELSTEEMQQVAANLFCDYIIVLHVYNDTEYDENIHNVECSVDIMNVGTGNEINHIGNILVGKGESIADENRDAMVQFIDDMNPVSLK